MIDIEVEDDAWSGSVPDVQGVVSRAAEQAAPPGDVVILLTDDETVRELNARFRGKDRPTNVLSFPAPETPGPIWATSSWPMGCARPRPGIRASPSPTT